MNFNRDLAADWLSSASAALPNLQNILSKAKSEVLIVGAGVFDIYHGQGWMPTLRRKTGDLDISVGLISGASDYNVLKEELLKNGYVNSEKKYRFHSPKKLMGNLTHIDLLAHPAQKDISAELTQKVMGVGENFSFQGFSFAHLSAFRIDQKLLFPNPIGMVGLKRASYLDNPDKRIKDLADIAEFGWGIVEKGTHFEMASLWESLKQHEDAKQVRQLIAHLGGGESTIWDLANARQELLKRNFTGSEIDDLIPERLLEWVSYLPE